MPRRLIFVESNTTGTGMLALRAAARLGLAPLLLTSRAGRYVGLAAAGAETAECDTNSLEALQAAVNGQGLTPAGITTTSEYYTVAVAELAARRGLPGNPPPAVRACRDKVATRVALAAAGVDQPRFVALRDHRELSSRVAEIGLPCVVKPVDESGSLGVRLCRSEPELHAQLRALLAVDRNVRDQPASGEVLVEEYLPGPEYSVEMFSVAGTAHCVGVTAKRVGGDPWFVEQGHVFPAPLSVESASSLVSQVERALRALGIREGPTHTEVRVASGRPAIIEINPRLAGGMIPELVHLAHGVDLVEQQLRAAAGLPVDLVGRCAGVAGIRFLAAGRPGTVAGVHGADHAGAVPGVRAVVVTARPGSSVAPARDSYGRLGHVIAVGADAAAVQATLDEAVAHIRFELIPTA